MALQRAAAAMRRLILLLAATTHALLLDPDTSNAPIVFSLDASPKLADHAFSAIASLSSVAHASKNASSLRFAFILTVPPKTVEPFTRALCGAIIAVAGKKMHVGHETPFCARRSLAKLMGDDKKCDVASKKLPARVTFIHFPQEDDGYPPRVRRVLELFCCAQRRWKGQRPELATSLGNHARFFAYLALLPLGARRTVFLDADTLAHDDLTDLIEAPLTNDKFVAAARRCAPGKAAYKPRFRFRDPLVQELGLRNVRQHVNAGVLVMDLQAYCEADIVEKLDRVLVRHITGSPLWHQGNNQPPFTIAAAAHTLFVHPSWNVRPGDARGQSQIRRKRGQKSQSLSAETVKEQCASMMRTAPRILHAHFRPCDALPPKMCMETPRERRDPAAMALKQSVLNLLRVAKRVKLPCSCKGRHFDDLDESKVDAALEAVEAVADAGLGLA